MFSVKRLTGMLRRVWHDRASSRYQLKRFGSTRRLYLETLEDRLCLSGGYLLVSSYNTDSVLRYYENTGAYVDTIVPSRSGGLREPMGVLFGPDHNLYVSSGSFDNNSSHGTGHKAVLQYSGTTGAFLSDFADQNQLFSPQGIIFGPDGNLYVADSDDSGGSVFRYNGTTGAFMDDFVPAGGLLRNAGPLVFGPDGDLYVGSHEGTEILRYEGPSGPNPGAFLGTFVPSGSGGLGSPSMRAFGRDGDLYVTSLTGGPNFAPGSVLRYEGPSGPNPGAFLGTFVPAGSGGLANPVGLLFGPDGRNDGKLDLYVASSVVYLTGSNSETFAARPGTSEVLRYDGTTGAFLGTFVTPDSGGLQLPMFMTFTETDPTTLNYDGATTSTALTAATTPSQTQPATASPTTTAARPVVASSAMTGSSIDPAAVSVALSLSQLPAMPAAAATPALWFAQAPLSVPSLTSNLPPAGQDTDSTDLAQTSTPAADWVFASLDGDLSLALLADDPAFRPRD